MSRFQSYATEGTRRATVTWQTLRTQPSWVMRTTIAVFLIIIAIPALLVLLIALLAATAVFLALWVVARIATAFRRVFPDSEGRRNVRVMPPR